jgi:hypothetical protein
MPQQRYLSPSSRVRNSFRPLFGARKTQSFWKQMQTVRWETLPSDYTAACVVAESNPAYPFPGLGNTFPDDETTVPNSRFRNLKPLDLRRELMWQSARLNYHASRIVPALESLARINGYLVAKKFEEAENAIEVHKKAYGLSLVLLKKEMLVVLERQGLPGLFRRYKTRTDKYQNTAWALLCHYVYDFTDPTFDPSRAMRQWRALSANRLEKSEWYARLLEDDIYSRSATDATLSSALLRFGAVSLLDLAISLWQRRAAHPGHPLVQGAFRQLDGAIQNVLVQGFSELQIDVAKGHIFPDRPPSDLEIYRTSFFYSDIAAVTAWRCQVSSLLFSSTFHMPSLEHDPAFRRLTEAAAAIAAAPRGYRKIVEDLRDWQISFLREGFTFSDQRFLTAAIVAESLRKLSQAAGDDAVAVAHLLASTEDIHLYTEGLVLKELLATEVCRDSPLLRFVVREMIYRRERRQCYT